MSELKAYSVQGHENGCVVFSTSGIAARRIAAQDLDIDFEGVESCRRAPQFDQYTPGPVPIKALMEDGWWWECFGCNTKLHGVDDNEDEEGNELELVFPNDRTVYCCQDCYESDQRERAERELADENLRAKFLAAFPGCTVVHTFGIPVDSVLFQFPGGKYDCRWNEKEPQHVFVSQVDVPAWEEHRKLTKTK